MGYFKVYRKIGLTGENPIIYDERGIFYAKKGDVSFNLPPGIYRSDTTLQVIPPIKYKLPKLPPVEKMFNNHDKAKLFLYNGDGPLGMASVVDNEIYLREDLLNKTTPQIMCVLYHELGHYYYTTEKYCDIFAINKMLKLGYNPSQFEGFLSILSNNSMDRKVFLTNYAKNISA